MCGKGYTGAACASCAPGYAPQGASSETPSCAVCSNGRSGLLPLVVLALVGSVLLALKTAGSGGPTFRLIRSRPLLQVTSGLSLATAFLQHVAVVASMDVGWGNSMSRFSPLLSLVSLDSSAAPLTCSLPHSVRSVEATYALLLSLPLVVPATLALAYGICLLRPVQSALSLPPSGLATPRMASVLLLFSEIGYVSLTTTLFLPLRCFPQPDGRLTLLWHPGTPCYSGRAWRNLALLALPGLVLYLLGIPAAFIHGVVSAGRSKASSPVSRSFLAAHAPLFAKYTPQKFYWALIELLAKVILTATSAFLSASPLAAVLSGVATMGLLLGARLAHAPFFLRPVNSLAVFLAAAVVSILALAPLHAPITQGGASHASKSPSLALFLDIAVSLLIVFALAGTAWVVGSALWVWRRNFRSSSTPPEEEEEEDVVKEEDVVEERELALEKLGWFADPMTRAAIEADDPLLWQEIPQADRSALVQALDAVGSLYFRTRSSSRRLVAEYDGHLELSFAPVALPVEEGVVSSGLEDSDEYDDSSGGEGIELEVVRPVVVSGHHQRSRDEMMAEEDQRFLDAALGLSSSPVPSRSPSRHRSRTGSDFRSASPFPPRRSSRPPSRVQSQTLERPPFPTGSIAERRQDRRQHTVSSHTVRRPRRGLAGSSVPSHLLRQHLPPTPEVHAEQSATEQTEQSKQ